MVFGLVQFEQQLHVFEAGVDMLDDPFFKFIHAPRNLALGIIDALMCGKNGFVNAFVRMDHSGNRADQS